MKNLQAKWLCAILVALVCLSLFTFGFQVEASGNKDESRDNFDNAQIEHVLLISVDGLHALDLARYVRLHPNSTLAHLTDKGVTYSNTSTSKPSDSFPGILSMTTGGSPNSTGVWYDNSYDRTLSPAGSNCKTVGTEVVYDESIDKNPDALDAGGGIDPAKLPLNPAKGCTPVYPHQYLRVNTIFEVAKAEGLTTAWADKHPAYELLNGPSGKGIDDLYTPEINNASSPTSNVGLTEAYDTLKVRAILNQIDGRNHDGTKEQEVPAIFGMNFQAVSVGQKLTTGGYQDGQGTPSASLQNALDFVDQSLGQMVAELKKKDLYASTLIIVTAKHGQAPMDPSQTNKPGDAIIPDTVNGVQAGLVAHATEDDVALLWLSDQSKTEAAVTALARVASKAGIEKILAGDALKLLFNTPGTGPGKDARVPDIIVLPRLGTIYTFSKKKNEEHGGFSVDDTSVALLVSNPGLRGQEIKSAVETYQIAPTILKALGLNPYDLQAVQKEKTQLLPGLKFEN